MCVWLTATESLPIWLAGLWFWGVEDAPPPQAMVGAEFLEGTITSHNPMAESSGALRAEDIT